MKCVAKDGKLCRRDLELEVLPPNEERRFPVSRMVCPVHGAAHRTSRGAVNSEIRERKTS